jgi:hypothetical protein
MTTEKVLAAWRTLNNAKYSKLDDADKVKVWKATRALRPIAEKFDEDLKDAAKKLKPSEDFDERLAKAQKYEVMIKQPDLDAEQLPMGAAEYAKFIDEFNAYNKLVDKAMKEYAEKKVEIEVEPLSEESFTKLMASNDWTMAQVVSLDDILVE